jgi:hypothetical protein
MDLKLERNDCLAKRKTKGCRTQQRQMQDTERNCRVRLAGTPWNPHASHPAAGAPTLTPAAGAANSYI